MGTWEVDKNKIRNPEIRKVFDDIFTGLTEVDLALDDLKIDTATPVNAVAATVNLTMDTQPTAGNTMTIGTKVYTFTADGTAAANGEIDVGADLPDAKTLVVAAINGSDGNNTAHTQVTAAAFSGNTMAVTAKIKGTVGNAIATTETFTAGTNVWASTTLAGGVNGTVGEQWELKVDASYLYVAVNDNTIADSNWRRISLGSAY